MCSSAFAPEKENPHAPYHGSDRKDGPSRSGGGAQNRSENQGDVSRRGRCQEGSSRGGPRNCRLCGQGKPAESTGRRLCGVPGLLSGPTVSGTGEQSRYRSEEEAPEVESR